MHGLQVSCSVIRAMRLFTVFPSFRLSVRSQSNYENSRVFITIYHKRRSFALVKHQTCIIAFNFNSLQICFV